MSATNISFLVFDRLLCQIVYLSLLNLLYLSRGAELSDVSVLRQLKNVEVLSLR